MVTTEVFTFNDATRAYKVVTVDDPRKHLILRANDLFSKGGFGDGDGFLEWAYDAFLPNREIKFRQEIDFDAIEGAVIAAYLIPLLAQFGHVVEFHNNGSIHNSWRATTYDGTPVEELTQYVTSGTSYFIPELDDCRVLVTAEQVTTVALLLTGSPLVVEPVVSA